MTFLRLLLGYFLQVMPFAVLAFYPFSNQMRFSKRKSVLLTSALILGLAFIFAWTGCCLQRILQPSQTLFTAVNVVFMLALLPCFLWYLYAVKTVWQKKLFVFSFALSSALIITSINNIISTRIPLSGTYDGLPYRGQALLVLFLLTAIMLPILLLILNRCYKPVEDGLTPKESTYLSILSLTLFLVLASVLSFIDYDGIYNSLSLFLFFALLVTVFVIYIIFFKMLYLAHRELTVQQKYDEAQRQLVLQQEQYHRIIDSMEIARRMRHDLRHHLVTMQGFLKSDQTEQAKQYLSQILKITPEHEIPKLCGNAVVNLVVSHYRALAEEQGIQFSVRIAIPDDLPILDADLSVMIGNLLENAIDAVKQVDHTAGTMPFIRLNMICSGKMLAVTVDNSFDGIVEMDGEQYLSTKPNHGGYGLQSVEAIAAKYAGGVEFTHEANVFHSSVMIGLRTPAEI